MFRVPVPHDDPAIVEALADLVEPLLSALPSSLRVCRCRPVDGTFCTNGEPAPGTTTKT
jgi:ferrochelatase